MTTKQLPLRKWMQASLAALIAFGIIGFGQAPAAAASSKVTGDQIINTGRQYLGVPYRFGAPSGISSSFDCSSFTQFVYKRHGITLPRVSSQQAKRGVRVAKANLKKGDLVFFKVPNRTGNSIGHVGIYAGNKRILHTFGAGGVKYSSLDASYWKTNYVTARRVI